MNPFGTTTLGEELYKDLSHNSYLNELYDNLLYNYAIRQLRLDETMGKSDKPVKLEDILRFADILSNSVGTRESGIHKTWAQEIMAILLTIYPNNEAVRYYVGTVLSRAGNYRGRESVVRDFQEKSLLESLYMDYNMELLALPTNKAETFFPEQKLAYEHFSNQYYSYSAPTSMGKSFLMRVFVMQQIQLGVKKNFAIVVPTKALINEVSSKLIDDLKDLLSECDYRVVTSAGSVALEQQHNYLFVLTPERLMYMLMDRKDLSIDYLFIDEAHKITSRDKRSAIYYNIIDMLAVRRSKPHIIFASPNVPNPEIYLELIPDADLEDGYMSMHYSPVTQFIYFVDYPSHEISIYNPHKKTYAFLEKLNAEKPFNTLLRYVSTGNASSNQTLIYCSSKDKTISMAKDFAQFLDTKNDKRLSDLARDIRNEVHGDYYLADLVEKGVAYHIGYLPADIRMRIEDYYRDRIITTLFCTSTLIEGVNLPADNLFITSYKSGLSHFSPVEFKNLIGRVGRLEYNLYGSVFVVRLDEKLNQDKFKELIEKDVPRQELSVVSELNKIQRTKIVEQLTRGQVQFSEYPKNQSEDNYDLMRKFGLILVKDLLSGRNSRVVKAFSAELSPEKITLIKEAFQESEFAPNDDITISSDQRENLYEAVRDGLSYPVINEYGGADYNETLLFMRRLLKIFKWDIYERGTLGKQNPSGEYAILSWYVVILLQWIQGYGLSNIIKESIDDKMRNNRSVLVSYGHWEQYNGSREHKNAVISETLEAIDDVVLFKISNYFLKFSEEYIKQHGECLNDWYEYVEYGTTNRLRILLQKSDFSREATDYINKHKELYVATVNGRLRIKKSILNCNSVLVKKEASSIIYNIPELFVEDI